MSGGQFQFLFPPPGFDLCLPFQGFRFGGKFLGVNDFFHFVRRGIMAAFFVLMLAKPPFQVVGNAGIDTVVGALDKVEEVHGSNKLTDNFFLL